MLELDTVARPSEVVVGFFSLDHTRDKLVRVPSPTAVRRIKLHDVVGVVDLELRVLVENFHWNRDGWSRGVRGFLRNGQSRPILIEFVIFPQAILRKCTQGEPAVIHRCTAGSVGQRRTGKVVDIIAPVRIFGPIYVGCIVKLAAIHIHIDIAGLDILVGEEQILLAANGGRSRRQGQRFWQCQAWA